MSHRVELEDFAKLAEPPDGAILTEGIAVVGFMEADGESYWTTIIAGDATSATLVGLLEMAKTDIMLQANPPGEL